MPGIDLHTHSTASDGTLAPAELIAEAKQAGLDALALTDHDTVAGLQEAMQASLEADLEFVPGCELSVTAPEGEIHILGLYLPPQPTKLIRVMDDLLQYRHDRNYIIVEKLQALGVDIEYAEVQDLAGEGSVGRPHIAKVLLNKGVVTSIQQAFDRFLGAKGKAYAPKKILTPAEGVKLLKEEGATVILAHPYLLHKSLDELRTLVLELKGYGLDGLEAYYSENSHTATRNYLQLAEELDMVVSGGTDFHGANRPKVRLGVGKGNMRIPYEVLEGIKSRRTREHAA